VKTYKIRTGFGKWSTVHVLTCANGHENRMIKNWSGPAPRGATVCVSCDKLVTIR
jgi:hypothetical protein